jgi:hypothetical protein
MMRGARLALLVLALLVSGCVSLSVEVERDASVEIPRDATWAWRPVPPESRGAVELDPRVDNPRARARVERAIDAALAAKGFRHVEADAADLLVEYHMGVWEEAFEIRPEPSPRLRGASLPPPVPGGTPMTIRYRQAGLRIDIVKRTTGQLAFRTIGERALPPTPMTDEALQQAVAELLERFP